ncbi:conserved hypothetical protein [Aspergillus terreus NIH2624]|uniref:Uncharacterized protein n=1 Tax=Aspergillus terreus (strain NIH 2624 / FGSC A1156) TaxID=341663 RepID=Q0CST1_ASPTN|nr:uncharacterized protein ATEG_03253 [Aspergillus terreus NIH2624]EAU36527.1 conserved hypothetical protein [Aspergillus terreus NIH2624]
MTKADPGADGGSASLNHGLPSGPVEARSLSAITAIASNPPTYPRNPTQKKLDPLVLYIVRVPGSRDVFLSPLKPPTKASVSAEAINSSLYYLHAATPDDEILLQECEQEREEEARLRKEKLENDPDVPQEFARMNKVRRKPVPGVAAPAGGNTIPDPSIPPPLPVRPPTLMQPQEDCPPPMPPRPSAPQRSSWSGVPAEQKPPLRRPLPSVPKDERSFAIQDGSMQKRPNRWSALSGYISGRGLEGLRDRHEMLTPDRHSFDSREPPRIRPHSSGGRPSYSSSRSPARSPGQSPTRRSYDTRRPEQPGFHITLIRRDPTHGVQWNVATMSTPRMDGSAIDIDIATPGYSRFISKNEPLSLADLGVTLSSNGQPISLTSLKPPVPTEPTSEPSHPRQFSRKLWVSKPYQPDEARSSLDTPGRASIDSLGGGNSPPKHPHGVKLKSGYYTFTSPWNGICTFSTSVNGRSLKCKHMIPVPGFSNNPTGGSSSLDNPAVTVAEIRFNTPFQAGHLHHHPNPAHVSPFTLSQTPSFPVHDPYASAASPDHAQPARTSKRASFAQLLNPNIYARPGSSGSGGVVPLPSGTSRHRRNVSTSSTSSADLEDRLDLSLARERAGGGMRGKSAKLGKLIIEDEGIKMLDLVVAACMAVWWRGYYY